jgi:hypothetical protein
MSSLGTWIYDNALAPIWGWFKGMFPGAAGVMEKLFAAIATVTGNLGNWVYDNAIKPIWDWIGLLFDNPKEAMDKLFGAVVGLGTWVYNNAILPVWTWLGTLFSDPMLAINQYFKFVGNIGKWIYDNAILPIWNWFGETFPGAKAKLLEFWNKIFVESSIGSYIYNQMLKPLWDWIGLLFTNPKEALDKLWKFFKSFDTWIFNTVLDPLWTWFSGMFPDVAASLTTFWNKLFSGDDKTLLGKVGIFLTDMWTWFKGLFNFTGGIGATVASLLNFTFFFPNLVVKLLGDAWDYIKGLFGFKKDEAKLPKDFSVGKMIVDTATAIWGFIKGIFGFGEKKEAEVDDTELDKIKSKFSLTDMISGLVDSIVDFFTGLFDIDVMGIFRDIFDAAGAAGKKAWNFVFGGDEEKRLDTEADLKKEEMVNATQAMAKLAQEFKTASLTADNIQLSDTALISLAKALTTGEGGVARSVVNNYVDNSSVTQSNATGNTIVNTKKNSKNEKAISEGN